MTRDADFKRLVRARATRTGERYSAARKHFSAAARARGPDLRDPSLLHVTNGDSVAQTLRDAGVAGSILSWRDVLHEGPVPAELSSDELRRTRAAYLARHHLGSAEEIARDFAERDRRVAGHRGDDVLWFEADLYDQLQLVQALTVLRDARVAPERVALVSAGEYPGIAHFGGLGQLTPRQLADLYEQRARLRPETFDLAADAWRAFRAPEPSGLSAIARRRSAELRFLAEAFDRLMQEYPWRSDGLSLAQRRILAAVADDMADAGAVFGHVGNRERRPYLGDLSCFDQIGQLAAARHPLLRIEGSDDKPFGKRRLTLTDAGQAVLAGRADHVALNGIDRWIGGVHLQVGETSWRYDERLESIVVVPPNGEPARWVGRHDSP